MSRNEDTSGVHLWLVLMKAHRALSRVAENSIGATGICLTDFKILEILLHRGPLPVNTLAARVDLTSGSATAAVDRLAARGLVERKSSPGDRRERIVHGTKEGLALATSAFAQHSLDMEAAASGLSQAERTTLLQLLRQFGNSPIEGTSQNATKTNPHR